MNPLSKGKIIGYLAAIFLAGGVAGTFIGFQAGRRVMFAPPHPDKMAERILGEWQTKLDLTAPQSQKIKLIIDQGMVEFGTMMNTQIMAAFSNTNVRVSAELTPEQKAKFEELQREHEKFIHNRFKGPTPGAGGATNR